MGAMQRKRQHNVVVERIKPIEGVLVVLLSLGAFLVLLWVELIFMRLVLG